MRLFGQLDDEYKHVQQIRASRAPAKPPSSKPATPTATSYKPATSSLSSAISSVSPLEASSTAPLSPPPPPVTVPEASDLRSNWQYGGTMKDLLMTQPRTASPEPGQNRADSRSPELRPFDAAAPLPAISAVSGEEELQEYARRLMDQLGEERNRFAGNRRRNRT